MWRVLRYCMAERRVLRKRVDRLEAALEAEAARNRQREDEMLSRVLTASGTYGIAPRRADMPLLPEPKKAPLPLSALQEARREAYRNAALAAGRPQAEADEYFEAHRNAPPIEVYEPPSEFTL